MIGIPVTAKKTSCCPTTARPRWALPAPFLATRSHPRCANRHVQRAPRPGDGQGGDGFDPDSLIPPPAVRGVGLGCRSGPRWHPDHRRRPHARCEAL